MDVSPSEPGMFIQIPEAPNRVNFQLGAGDDDHSTYCCVVQRYPDQMEGLPGLAPFPLFSSIKV